MATRDYAKKKRSNAAASRAPRKKKSAPAPQKRSLPLLKVVLSLLFLVGFGYGLWQLTSVRPDNTDTPAAQANAPSKPAPAAKPQAKPVPSKPQTAAKPAATNKNSSADNPPVVEQSERFEFYKMLPESEVDTTNVEPYKSTPKDVKPKHTYILQVGSFQNGSDAERLRAQLILQGLPNVQTRKVTNSNGTVWHQVRTGPFDNRSQLNKAQDKLVRMNIQPLVKRID